MYSPLYKAERKNKKTRVADANNTIIIRTIKQGIPTYTNKLNPFQIPFIDSHCHLDRLFNLTHYRGTFSQFKGGVQGNIFGRISFELWARQVPLIIGETFGEVPGPQRPTVSEPRPVQKLGVK